MYPGISVSSWLSTTIESWGISATFRVSRLIELWAKATKGTTKKARTINANIVFIIRFLLLIKHAKSPSRDSSYGIATDTLLCTSLIRRIYMPQGQETCPGEVPFENWNRDALSSTNPIL